MRSTNSTDVTKGKHLRPGGDPRRPTTGPGSPTGPDLLGVSIDPATQRTTFAYDEPVAAGPPAAGFLGFRSDATSVAGQGAAATNGAAATVAFGADIGSLVAYGQPYATVTDAAGRPNPNQSVSKDAQVAAPIPLPTPVPERARGSRRASESFRRRGRVTLRPRRGRQRGPAATSGA